LAGEVESAGHPGEMVECGSIHTRTLHQVRAAGERLSEVVVGKRRV
jgi:hypothetical protein